MWFWFWESVLDSGKCFWVLRRVLDSGEVFLDSGMCFGFWEVFLDFGTCFRFWEVFSSHRSSQITNTAIHSLSAVCREMRGRHL